MIQVGDQVHLTVIPVPSGSVIYSYVWDFWDGSSTATINGSITKTVNIGGQPGSGTLAYSARPVAIDGRSVVMNGSFIANNPPLILPGPAITVNDAVFVYQTRLSLTALDVDLDSFNFYWYTGTTLLGTGNTVVAGLINGTWSGNGTTIIQGYPAKHNSIDLSIASDRTVTCYVVDARNGTSSVDFNLRGQDNQAPSLTVAAGVEGVTFDASTPPTARIGAGQFINFTVFVAPLPSHTLNFLWSFFGSNGWTMAPVHDAGTLSVLPNGGYQNTVVRDISLETVFTGTGKTAEADVRVTATNTTNSQITFTDAQFFVTLIKNSVPSAVTVSRKINGVDIGGSPVSVGQVIEFSAAGTDADQDMLFYKWQFAQPFTPNPLYLWGATVLYDTAGYASGQSIVGSLRVIDRFGGQLTVVLPVTDLV